MNTILWRAYFLIKGELIVSRNYRMPIYRDFQRIKEYIVSHLQYRVSQYAFILSFSVENSPKIPKILRKFRKFRKYFVISENLPKIRQKFLKKKVFFEALISYRIVSRKKPSYRIDIVSNRKKAYRYWLVQCMKAQHHRHCKFSWISWIFSILRILNFCVVKILTLLILNLLFQE